MPFDDSYYPLLPQCTGIKLGSVFSHSNLKCYWYYKKCQYKIPPSGVTGYDATKQVFKHQAPKRGLLINVRCVGALPKVAANIH